MSSWTNVGPEASAPAEEEHAPETVRFEKRSPSLKGSCSFVRRLAGMVLKVRIRFAPKTRGPSPPAEEQRPPSSGKAAAKAKAKAAPAEPAQTAKETHDLAVHELHLPLAPLILPGKRKRGGEAGEVHPEPPEVVEEGPASVLFNVLESIRVGVRCDGQVMSEEVAAHLNPLLISVNGVNRLPHEEHAGQTRGSVSAVLAAFGQRLASEPCALSAHGSGRLNFHRVFFAGTWDQRELRECLQTERFLVEVHDREREQGSEAMKHSRGHSRKKAKDAEAEQAPLSTSSHGVAHFMLGELASAHPSHALELRLDVEPICKRRRRLGSSPSTELKVASIFGEGGQELADSVRDVQHEHTPGYMDSGSFIRLTARIARPLAPPSALPPPATPRATSGSQSPRKSRAPAKGTTVVEAPAVNADGTLRRGGFFRIVVVVDNSKVTMLKRLLNLIWEHNVATLQLDPARMKEYHTLATVELSEEQRNDPNLDILTGFVVMDRNTRVVVVEGVRDGAAMHRVADALGVGVQRVDRFKVLANKDLAWNRRLYGEFGVCLKQIKLRMPTLSALTMRPDVCLSGRAEQEAAAGLHSLVAMRQAERLQLLTKADSFPCARALITIETQYGQFVTPEERDCEVARHRDSTLSSATVNAAAILGSAAATTTLRGSATVRPEDLPASEEEGQAAAGLAEPEAQTIRIKKKPPLDMSNRAYEGSLTARSTQPAPNLREANKAFLRELSLENEKANATLRNVGPRKVVDTSFLEGQLVHIYSGQKYNSAELQKQALRANMQGEEGHKLWTYSVERNSGCFPMLEKEIPLDKMLRQSVYVEDSREPFRYPRQRQKEDFRRPVYDVSEARKEDLATPWIENQMYPELEGKEIIRGAFDSQTLGTGGAHVIPERRPLLHHPPGCRTPPPEREPLQPPMRLGAKVSMGLENFGDKYNKSILEGEPQTRSLRFEERSVPRSVTRKFGLGAAPTNVEIPPLSLNLSERYEEVPGNSDCLTNFMKDVSRAVAVHREPPASDRAPTGGGRAAAAAATVRQVKPPESARERGSSGRPFMARFTGTQAWSARVGAGAGSLPAQAQPVSAR